MLAREIYHSTVKQALIHDGWTVTHDPLRLRWRATDTYVDLAGCRKKNFGTQIIRMRADISLFSAQSWCKSASICVHQRPIFTSPNAYRDVDPIVVYDQERDHYLLLAVGWEGVKRVHGCIVHVSLQDGTEDGVTDELIALGIPLE